MATVTIRDIPDEIHHAIRIQAAQNGRSTVAEIRMILETAVKPKHSLRMGDALAEIRRRVGINDKDLLYFEREKISAEPIKIES